MVLFPSSKSFLFQISLRRNRLKRSTALFRPASLHSRKRKADSSLSGALSHKLRGRENKKHLPEEVIMEILLRLPVKSLMRFMFVSKSWFSLISSPHFAELHFQRSSQPHRVLVSADGQFQSIDFNASFHDDSAVVKLNFPRRRTPTDLEIMGSCRGFLFLVGHKKQKLFLWNPSNGVCRKIPPLNPNIFVYMYGFAYDESTDDYLLVLVSRALAFFSLKTKSWWEVLDAECQYTCQSDGPTAGSIFNGAIHWFAKRIRQPPPECFTIIAFDIITKNLREIPVPDDFEYGMGILGVVGGCLTLTENCDVIKMWVMREYGVKSSWTKLYTVSPDEGYIESITPLCFNKDSQLVAIDSVLGLAKLNDRGELLEHLEFCPTPYSLACASVYTESLLSLPWV